MIPADKQAAVLVVDDQDTVRRVVYVALRARGIPCWVAGSGEAAAQILTEHLDEIGAALVDLNMPAMDGLATVAKLRTIKANLPCILATGSVVVDEAAFVASGAVAVIPKPFSLDHLHSALVRLCDTK